MKVTTLLPTAGNDGRPFPDAKIDGILDSLATQFGGCSTDGKVDGRSMDDGRKHRDQSLRVTIVCDKDRLQEVRDRIIEIGQELEQSSMYLEVRDYDGVQFLRIR
jgi:hypothetical protein